MTDENSALALEAGPEAVSEPQEGVSQETEGQVEDQTAPADAEEEKKRESARERRERDKAYKQRLRDDAAEANAAAAAAEAKRARILDAGKQEKPPSESDYADPLEYVAAKAVWASQQKAAEREAGAASAEAEEARQRAEKIRQAEAAMVAQNWTTAVSEAKARYADFDAVALSGDVPINEDMARIIQTSDVGPDVAYHLGRNKALAAEISKMPPIEAARAIGRIEASMMAPKPRTETSAPTPISPVRATGAATKDPAKMTVDEYRAWRQAGGKF